MPNRKIYSDTELWSRKNLENIVASSNSLTEVGRLLMEQSKKKEKDSEDAENNTHNHNRKVTVSITRLIYMIRLLKISISHLLPASQRIINNFELPENSISDDDDGNDFLKKQMGMDQKFFTYSPRFRPNKKK